MRADMPRARPRAMAAAEHDLVAHGSSRSRAWLMRAASQSLPPMIRMGGPHQPAMRRADGLGRRRPRPGRARPGPRAGSSGRPGRRAARRPASPAGRGRARLPAAARCRNRCRGIRPSRARTSGRVSVGQFPPGMGAAQDAAGHLPAAVVEPHGQGRGLHRAGIRRRLPREAAGGAPALQPAPQERGEEGQASRRTAGRGR